MPCIFGKDTSHDGRRRNNAALQEKSRKISAGRSHLASRWRVHSPEFSILYFVVGLFFFLPFRQRDISAFYIARVTYSSSSTHTHIYIHYSAVVIFLILLNPGSTFYFTRIFLTLASFLRLRVANDLLALSTKLLSEFRLYAIFSSLFSKLHILSYVRSRRYRIFFPHNVLLSYRANVR